jgi:DNA-directed RNA polymerase subunit RPC12/RpoP
MNPALCPQCGKQVDNFEVIELSACLACGSPLISTLRASRPRMATAEVRKLPPFPYLRFFIAFSASAICTFGYSLFYQEVFRLVPSLQRFLTFHLLVLEFVAINSAVYCAVILASRQRIHFKLAAVIVGTVLMTVNTLLVTLIR